MRVYRLLLATVPLLLAGRLSAQTLELGLGLGTLVPQGSLADHSASGFVGIASLGIPFSKTVGVRLEALWANSDLNGKLISSPGSIPADNDVRISGDVRLVGGLASATLDLGTGFLRPYVLAGAGLYQRSVSQRASGAFADLTRLDRDESTLGLHGGVGVRTMVLGAVVFGELRYHTVRTEESPTNFVPLLVGIRF
jgi:hypothetical protein